MGASDAQEKPNMLAPSERTEADYTHLLEVVTVALLKSRVGELLWRSASDEAIEQAAKDADAVLMAMAADVEARTN